MTTESPAHQPSFGESLRSWRLERRLTQRAFGDLFVPHVRHSTVSCWEQGLRRPSWKFLGQIVAITGIPAHLVLRAGTASAESARP
jgi:transcriptional regulator with XRE-family HTH domain